MVHNLNLIYISNKNVQFADGHDAHGRSCNGRKFCCRYTIPLLYRQQTVVSSYRYALQMQRNIQIY
jgi:hypothetical protein